MVFLFSLEPPDTEDLDTFAAPEQGDQQLMCRTVHAQDWRELWIMYTIDHTICFVIKDPYMMLINIVLWTVYSNLIKAVNNKLKTIHLL